MYTISELEKRAREIHGDKYVYVWDTYKKVSEKMKMICPEHGEFWQSMHEHINKKQGCPKCGSVKRVDSKRYTTDEFIKKAREIHGDKYDYSKVEYKDSLTKVCIVCPEHGEFWQRPDGHLQGKGCKKCNTATEYKKKFNNILTKDDFLKKVSENFGDGYEYDLSGYKNLSSKILIKCKIHGWFEQTASAHLNSPTGCPKCSYEVDRERKLSNTGDFIEKSKKIHGDKYDYSKTEYKDANTKVCIICPEHSEFWQTPYNHLSGNGCPICALSVPDVSNEENELYDYIRTIYGGEIIRNDRTVLNGKEIDIYVPEKKLAFEFDGLYWHSEIKKENINYHLDKTEICEKNGITLIHIFEDEWNFKKEICKSRIRNILGITDKRIYGRECTIKLVDGTTKKKFLIDNHVQGDVKSSINLGLYFEGELLSIMTFGGLRRNLGSKKKEDVYELLRFCNKINYTVVGGAGKLFNYFIKNYNPKQIISYCDRRWSTGNMYDKLGFELEWTTKPNYFYVIKNERKNRFNYRKDILVSKYGCLKEESEHNFCLKNGWYRIYDCGSYRFVWNNKNKEEL